LYEELEQIVITMFYRDRNRFLDIARHAMALNGSFFNTQCMVSSTFWMPIFVEAVTWKTVIFAQHR